MTAFFTSAADDHLVLWRGHATESFTSPEYRVSPFNRAVLSWNVIGGATLELQAGGVWYLMGRWNRLPHGEKTESVDVDTLILKQNATSLRFRATLEAGAILTLLAGAHWIDGEKREYTATRSAAWGKILAVSERSQMAEEKDPGGICSPTSLAMLLEFHGIKKTIREVADGVFDHAQKLYGNWPFNTAYAYQVSGLPCYVRRGLGLEDLEDEITAGRPVIIGHKWSQGELTGPPISNSDGHLILVIGFTQDGDLVVNDPAAPAGAVRRVYKRRELYTTWLERACGIMYVMMPRTP